MDEEKPGFKKVEVDPEFVLHCDQCNHESTNVSGAYVDGKRSLIVNCTLCKKVLMYSIDPTATLNDIFDRKEGKSVGTA